MGTEDTVIVQYLIYILSGNNNNEYKVNPYYLQT
jgi:hypothetical protein